MTSQSAERLRVLFVDDEPNVLAGLRRMLHARRVSWERVFATGGPEALALMEERRFDVIVADLRMPIMTGTELLDRVRVRHPDTIRIVLSGQLNSDAVLPTVRSTHRFLAKPCDGETLVATVSRAVALREVLRSEPVRRLVGQIDQLPSVPQLFTELEVELQRREPSIRRAARLVAQDMGMSAKVLQLVNSAYFAPTQQVTSVERAVAMIGLETLRALVLTLHVFGRFPRTRLRGFNIERLWQHSLDVGKFAHRLLRIAGANEHEANAALVAGLLHATGKMVFAEYLPDAYRQVIEANAGPERECELELEVFGVSHAEVGAYLLGLWGLPDVIVEAVAWHHRPSARVGDDFSPTAAVHLADLFSMALRQRSVEDDSFQALKRLPLDWELLERVGAASRLGEWLEAVQREES